VPDDSGPWFQIGIGRPENHGGGATLVVDRNLQVREVTVNGGETLYPTPAEWRDHWCPIVENGKYAK